MKKFLGIFNSILVLATAACIALGVINVSFTTPPWMDTLASSANGVLLPVATTKAEQVRESDEEALRAFNALDDTLWKYVQNDDKAGFAKLFSAFPEDQKQNIDEEFATFRKYKSLIQKTSPYILASADGVYYCESMHYLVTKSGSKTHMDNYTYRYVIKKIDGEWRFSPVTEEEENAIMESYLRRMPSGFQQAYEARRNAALFGNYMWMEPELVLEGCTYERIYTAYQNEDGSVDVHVALSNGTDKTVVYSSLTVRIDDAALGQIVNQKTSISIRVLPGNTEYYVVHVNANNVKKNGVWGSINAHIDATWD